MYENKTLEAIVATIVSNILCLLAPSLRLSLERLAPTLSLGTLKVSKQIISGRAIEMFDKFF